MEIEFTGNETPEELEALIEGLGEVVIDDDTPPAPLTPENDGGDDVDVVAENTGDKQDTPTPGVMATTPNLPATPPAARETPTGILSKDGQHVIPYEVLVAERAEKQRLASTHQQTATDLADVQRQLAALTRQIHSAGMQPVPLPEHAQITPEQINGIREDFPEMAAMFDTLVQKIDYLQQGQPAAAAPPSTGHPVAEAMQAVPDLTAWQTTDPDRFTLAVHIDTYLQQDPDWQDKSLTERFTEVAKRTRAAYGESVDAVQPTTTPIPAPLMTQAIQQNAAEKLALATAESQVPLSPSELGVTTAQTPTPLEQAVNASPAQLQALFSGMTDEQIDALLEQALQ
ncbi:hypothetical protein [Yersinia mollaretii]|uniref:hypothetical protein n=1 Tax=Yersinia mollaretii TaxID=33060 RepID=UPI00119DDB90|nr:hypothetical protein [Yersinia mollaretii]